MSSPIARAEHTGPRDTLIGLHQNLSHKHRTRILAERLGQTLGRLHSEPRCIDLGCGDMQIAEALEAALPSSSWECLDLYPLPRALATEPRWHKYRQFDGNKLPLGDNTRDVALFCDVLHHMPPGVPQRMLSEAGRVARHVVVKDHFEYGLWSRSLLRAMDFVGNWAYGVSVPRRYFDRASFDALVQGAGLRVESMQVGVSLYAHLGWPGKVLRDKWQFIAVLTRAD